MKTAILGAGIAGLAYASELEKENATIFEKNDFYGGLCHSFEVNGFRFDSAVHLSFTNETTVREVFDKTPYIKHLPLAYNFYKGYWLKHPVVNNLYQLEPEEKVRLLKSFIDRNAEVEIKDYKDWLLASYGEEISKAFYEVYTRKYWTLDAEKLSTTWIGNRLGTPDVGKMLWGTFTSETGIDYYAKEMRYPVNGGYQAFVDKLAESARVEPNKEVVCVDLERKELAFRDGTTFRYEKLASSIPLPELVKVTKNVPVSVKDAADKLTASKISLVSVGFNKKDVPKSIWFYIYDEDIMAARVNSPSMKSPKNAPENCSSLQFEIYHAPDAVIDPSKIVENTKYALQKMRLCEEADILFMDYRLLDYGNVIFWNGMEKEREIVRNYYDAQGVDLIGRFGEWEYYWSDQSFMSGKKKGKLSEGK